MVLASKKYSFSLYSLLQSAANAVLTLMSVSIKSLSVSNMLLECSLGKLKYDSTTLPMSGFLGHPPVSASKPHASFAIFIFLLIGFQYG